MNDHLEEEKVEWWFWFSRLWWIYLLDGCTGWTNFWCRASLHKCGPVYYNTGGFEPNMCCKNCGEDLG